MKSNKLALNKRIELIKHELERKIEGRLVNEEQYQLFLKIKKNRTYPIELFYILYKLGNENIKIETLTLEGDGKFTISGSCRDDALFESELTTSPYLDKLSFSFSRKNGTIFYKITGNFIYESGT